MLVWLTICHHPAHHRGFWGLLMATYSLVWSYQTTCALEGLNTPRSTVGQPRAAFDQPTIPERGRMQLAGSCSLQDNILAMEKQCHPTPLCLRCGLTPRPWAVIQVHAQWLCHQGSFLKKRETSRDRKQVSRTYCVPVLWGCREWGLGPDHLDLFWHLLHLAPCSPGKA